MTSGLAFTTQPSSLTVDVGGSATFQVAATSSGTISYQWYRDDTVILGATSASYTLNPMATTDAIDSNGTMFINGGVVVAEGSGAPECGLDCDQNEFGFSGGTVVGMGGGYSTPWAASCSQNVVSLGAGAANTLKVVLDGNNKVVFAFLVPYTCEAVLVSTALFNPSATDTASRTFTAYTGGTVTAYTTLFNGLYLGVTGYTKGTQGKTFTFTSAFKSL